MTAIRWVALAGGVGGAKLAAGLQATTGDSLAVVVNTGDDFDYLGLRICPDIDSNLYALSGRNDPERGWGRRDETWHFMESLRELVPEAWFQLGDRDLALHLYRSERLRVGVTLTDVTAEVATRFGLRARLWPMSDAAVRTAVVTTAGTLAFQDYFVRQRAAPVVTGFHYTGAASAEPPAVAGSVWGMPPEAVILCPSNPFVSLQPILAVPAWRDWLANRRFPVVAVSPVVGGQALKGPAAKMLAELRLPVSSLALCDIYDKLLDGLVIDSVDRGLAAAIEARGIACLVTDTIMRTPADQARLAAQVQEFAARLGTTRRAR